MGGPIAGPRNGASRNTELAAARCWGSQMSELVPAPTAKQPEPRAPARKRHVQRAPKVWQKPAPRVKRSEGGNKAI